MNQHTPSLASLPVEAQRNLFINRELSWLKFNERVLGEAARDDVPLCERLSFLSIFQTNLDEFFKVRIGALVDRLQLGGEPDEKTGLTVAEQLDAARAEVQRLSALRAEIWNHLRETLQREAATEIVPADQWSAQDKAAARTIFREQMADTLSVVLLGKHRSPPFLRDRETYLAVLARRRGDAASKSRLGFISCTLPAVPRLLALPGKGRFALSEEILRLCAANAFPDCTLRETSLFRLTRNADIDPDREYDDERDYREFMADLMRRRKRLNPVRLEIESQASPALAKALGDAVGVGKETLCRSDCPFDFSFLAAVRDSLRHRPELFWPRFTPRREGTRLAKKSLFAQIRDEDRLFFYPYDSMEPFLQWLREAATDPQVVSIRMTLYRVARESRVVETLIEAAENGKDVLVLVELKARFDEENNIEWSRRLEAAGCQVVYGLEGFKVHCKLCLVMRKGRNGIEYFTHAGTGNYNEKTARLYTDYALMTADEGIGRDAVVIFRALALGELPPSTERILVAPRNLQEGILERIGRQIERARSGRSAYIGLKLNALTDRRICWRLAEASAAGVTVDLVVRGICCLRPGLAGLTDKIRVVSVVGRFLEHARVYIFGSGREAEVFLASADFMTRNTRRRVETAVPIRAPKLKRRIVRDFGVMLSDSLHAHELGADGIYRRRNPDPRVDSQLLFCQGEGALGR
ncbi:MAG: polyphosphate kinase 1 [Kiritimatiellia bacterium]